MSNLKCINISNKTDLLYLLFFIVFIFTSWSFYIFTIVPYLEVNHLILYAIIYVLGFQFLIFDVIPVFCYLKYFEKTNPIVFLKLDVFITKKTIKYPIIVMVAMVLQFLFFQYLILDYINFQPFLPLYEWVVVTVAPFTEELIYRGTILQKLNQYMSFKKANFITALLFAVTHIPTWITNSHSLTGSSIYVFIVGLILGWIFNKTGSLWPAIIIHSFHNFIKNALSFV